MKLSVVCLAYNHEKYIEKTLRGFVDQVTDFDFEVLVADDASTDSTVEIIRRYAEAHSSRIKPILREKNLGAARNADDVYSRVDSDYVTFCEGDDYWSDVHFLQKGIDFLDEHPDCIAFCANSLLNYVDQRHHELFNASRRSGWITLGDNFNNHPSARIFRYQTIMPQGDVPMLHYLLSQGPSYYHSEVASVYNIHGSGLWSSLSPDEAVRRTMALWYTLNEYFEYNYDNFYAKRIIVNKTARRLLKPLRKVLTPKIFWKWYYSWNRFPTDEPLVWMGKKE